jgi:hypothetical protein
MKKKWWPIGLATLAICGGIAVAIPALQPPGPGVTKANFDRVEDGMSREDVEAILGEDSELFLINAGPTHATRTWTGADGSTACISFYILQGVRSKRWTESTETIPDKLRRWLPLPRK